MKSRSCRLSKHEPRIRHRGTAPDLHKATRYANVRDLWLFLFDSRNYYMDCIRMDENHILCPKKKDSSAATNRFRCRGENYFRVCDRVRVSATQTFTILLYIYVYICVGGLLLLVVPSPVIAI